MENAISNFFISACAKSLFLYYFIADDVPRCLFGDSTRLQQIVSHLISNAIKFTSTGGVTVKVSCGSTSSHSSSSTGPVTLYIDVEDSGIGIAPEKFNLLFQRFSTLHDDTQTGGTGLGLALCKKVAQKMGGDVFLKSSAVNKGSTFSIRLPMKVGSVSFCQAPFLKLMQEMHVDRNSLPVLGCILRELSYEFFQSVCDSIGLKCELIPTVDDAFSWASSLNGKQGIIVCDLMVALEWSDPHPSLSVVLLLPPHHLTHTQRRRLSPNSSEPPVAVPSSSEAIQLDRIPKSFLRLLLPIRRIGFFETVLKALKSGNSQEEMDLDSRLDNATTPQVESLEKLKVVIVEDNKINQKVLCKMLNSVSIEPVVVVGDGLKSVQFF
eukprot:TRINITY_DN19863_c0_g1_i1.p1 TRINITY_DN19863_c0_g1~~TRINITY_DN19863_c0_g1_i1.p1  ORF type:complete len:404 (-),score=95.41 TRINITY_DN19863_c0_g1_i1:358-1497(-)